MSQQANQPDNENPLQVPKMQIHEVQGGPPHEGDAGRGLLFRTSRGDLTAILHAAPDSHLGVIWVCGARGGFGGPAQGVYVTK